MLFDNKRWKLPEVSVEIEPWRKVLLDAADLLEKKGWTKGKVYSHGRYCAIGAIHKAAGFSPHIAEDDDVPTPLIVDVVEDRVVTYLNDRNDRDENDRSYYSVPDWNDSQKRGRVVIETLRAVAKS